MRNHQPKTAVLVDMQQLGCLRHRDPPSAKVVNSNTINRQPVRTVSVMHWKRETIF